MDQAMRNDTSFDPLAKHQITKKGVIKLFVAMPPSIDQDVDIHKIENQTILQLLHYLVIISNKAKPSFLCKIITFCFSGMKFFKTNAGASDTLFIVCFILILI